MRNSQQYPKKAADRQHRVHEKLGALANIPRRAVYITVEYFSPFQSDGYVKCLWAFIFLGKSAEQKR